jgi:hypothetical protein
MAREEVLGTVPSLLRPTPADPVARQQRAAMWGSLRDIGSWRGELLERRPESGLRRFGAAIECGVGNTREQLSGVRNFHAPNLLKYRVKRQCHVRSRVAVGHRKHIDLVDVLLLLQQPADAGAQGSGETQAVERLQRRECGR